MQNFESKTILHRDIKLENIFLMKTQENNYGTVKVGDFGFARMLDNEDSNASLPATTYLGSPLTMAPEIAERKNYNQQVDVYSLGVIFY